MLEIKKKGFKGILEPNFNRIKPTINKTNNPIPKPNNKFDKVILSWNPMRKMTLSRPSLNTAKNAITPNENKLPFFNALSVWLMYKSVPFFNVRITM